MLRETGSCPGWFLSGRPFLGRLRGRSRDRHLLGREGCRCEGTRCRIEWLLLVGRGVCCVPGCRS